MAIQGPPRLAVARLSKRDPKCVRHFWRNTARASQASPGMGRRLGAARRIGLTWIIRSAGAKRHSYGVGRPNRSAIPGCRQKDVPTFASDRGGEREEMETYPVDIDAGQVVRWLRQELEADPSRFRVAGWLSRETEKIPRRREFRLGDEEREDLSEVATVVTLDIAPVDGSEGWRLSVVVEDEAGPHISDRGGGNERSGRSTSKPSTKNSSARIGEPPT